MPRPACLPVDTGQQVYRGIAWSPGPGLRNATYTLHGHHAGMRACSLRGQTSTLHLPPTKMATAMPRLARLGMPLAS